MQVTDRFVPRDSNIASEDFDGEFVVLDLDSGKYFSLAGAAAVVWRGLLAGHSVETLTAALPGGDARRDAVAGLVGSLVAHGLLVPGNPPAPADAALADELVSADGFGIDVFDDLADLLVADPIHDVDQQAGWPHRPGDTDA
jgi:hypothetical protein